MTERYKLVHFYVPDVNYWELYDLEKDPHELRSVYGQPDYAQVQADLHKEVIRLRQELKVPEKDPPGAYGGRLATEGQPAPAAKKRAGKKKSAQ